MSIRKKLKRFFFGNHIAGGISVVGFFTVITIILLELTSFKQTAPLSSKIIWPQFDGNGARTGVNAAEFLINSGDVSSLKLLWQKALPYTTNGTPVEVPNVSTANGNKDLLFLTTQKGSLVAVDAATGTKVWQADTTGNFVGSQGTSSSPAIDPSGQFVYSYGLDGKVHKYAVATGAEDTTKGFPVAVTMSTDVEKISAPLTIGNGYLYTVTSGYDGDFGSYVGHVVAINLTTGTTSVFNSLCSNVKQLSAAGFCAEKGSGIWSRAGAVVDPASGNVFVVTGNGNYNASTGGNNYGDSIVELKADLSSIVDSYTPTTFSSLDSQDDDLGSTGIAILPQQTNTATPSLIVVGGKDNKVRLLNKDNLSGAGGPNHTGGELQTVATSCQTLAHPISWNDTTGTTWIFFTDTCANLYAFKVVNSNNASKLTQVYQKSNIGKNSAFMANGILFIPNSNNISALEPTTGNVLWSSNQTSAGGNIGSLHWQSPLVVNGTVAMPDDNGNLTAYALTNVNPQPTTGGGAGSTTFAVTICPHGLGNCGDNVGPSGGNTNPVHATKMATITTLNSANQPITSGTGMLTYNPTSKNYTGTVSIPSVPNGQYLVNVSLQGFLSKQNPGITTLPATSMITIPSLSLVNGDINNDGQLDISDYNALISCYGTKQTSATCTTGPTTQTAGSDLNDDGKVNGADYNLILREFSVQQGSIGGSITPTPSTGSVASSTPTPTIPTSGLTTTPPVTQSTYPTTDGTIEWEAGWETGDTSQWGNHTGGSWGNSSLDVATTPVRWGKYSGKLTLNPSGNGSARAEITASQAHTGGTPGAEWFYSFSVYFPSNPDQATGWGSWNDFTQWMDTRANCSPPEQLDVLGSGMLSFHNELTTQESGNCGYGTLPTKDYDIGQIVYDQWIDFTVHLKFSEDPAVGFAQVWRNGQEVLPLTHMQTLDANSSGVYMEQAMYRPNTPGTSIIYIDGTRRHNTYNGVTVGN